jgi:hypothetical protein
MSRLSRDFSLTQLQIRTENDNLFVTKFGHVFFNRFLSVCYLKILRINSQTSVYFYASSIKLNNQRVITIQPCPKAFKKRGVLIDMAVLQRMLLLLQET